MPIPPLPPSREMPTSELTRMNAVDAPKFSNSKNNNASNPTKVVLDFTKIESPADPNAKSLLNLVDFNKINVVVPPGRIITLNFSMANPADASQQLNQVITLRSEKHTLEPKLVSFSFDKHGRAMLRTNTKSINEKTGELKREFKVLNGDQLIVLNDAEHENHSKPVGLPRKDGSTPIPLMSNVESVDRQKRAKKFEVMNKSPQAVKFRAQIAKELANESAKHLKRHDVEINTGSKIPYIPALDRSLSSDPSVNNHDNSSVNSLVNSFFDDSSIPSLVSFPNHEIQDDYRPDESYPVYDSTETYVDLPSQDYQPLPFDDSNFYSTS